MPSTINSELRNGVGVTTKLCSWVSNLKIEDIPPAVIERAKYLLLDGIACALVGAHVPWSEKYVEATMRFEPVGYCTVMGHDKKLGPVAASMMNAAFIQATELDDYHSEAPLHAASIAIPSISAIADFLRHTDIDGSNIDGGSSSTVSGTEALLAAIACFESGPRIGKAVHGADLLVNGWHCGAVYGTPAGALAAGKALGLSVDQLEDAVGIACTQACGLMSAQYGGMIKRVQHGFAARSGILGALLAHGGYEGIKQVLERPYGGFLTMFTKGNNKEEQFRELEVISKLGSFWHTFALRIKMYACCGLTHGAIEAIENLQALHSKLFESANLKKISKIHVELSHSSFAHCGWHPERSAITPTAAQMSAPFILATQFVHGKCLLSQFSDSNHNLDRDDIWDLVGKVECSHNPEFDQLNQTSGGHIWVEFEDGTSVNEKVSMPRGVKEPITNELILEKYRTLTVDIMSGDRVKEIEDLVMGMENIGDIGPLIDLLGQSVNSPFT